MSAHLHEIPLPLAAVGFVAGLLGGVLLLWLVWRGLRRMVDSPRVPLHRATYVVLSGLCLALLGLGLVAVGVGRLLRDHVRLEGERTPVAELRCAAGAAGKVRITWTPADGNGGGPSEVESEGPDCRVAAELVTMRALPARLGVPTLVRVIRVGEAVQPAENPAWLTPVPDGPPSFPLTLVVREARRAEVQARPDPQAVYRLLASPSGLVLERRGG